MINPDRVHRSKAEIIRIRPMLFGGNEFHIKTIDGILMHGWDISDKFKVGDIVNIQFQFSIMSDWYVVKTVNKIKGGL